MKRDQYYIEVHKACAIPDDWSEPIKDCFRRFPIWAQMSQRSKGDGEIASTLTVMLRRTAIKKREEYDDQIGSVRTFCNGLVYFTWLGYVRDVYREGERLRKYYELYPVPQPKGEGAAVYPIGEFQYRHAGPQFGDHKRPGYLQNRLRVPRDPRVWTEIPAFRAIELALYNERLKQLQTEQLLNLLPGDREWANRFILILGREGVKNEPTRLALNTARDFFWGKRPITAGTFRTRKHRVFERLAKRME